MKKIAIVGAGFAGSVLGRELAESGSFSIDVFDTRTHVAGNCHTTRDEKTGVMIHNYGPHIFHTNREDVWNYITRFGKFGPYVNRVKAHTAKGVFSLPINLMTINQFFQKKLGPQEAREFVSTIGDDSIHEPQTFEEQALKFLGEELYTNFFYGYTKKQWGVEPKELPASILQRLPVRFNYDDNYYNSRFQGIPMEGYTKIVQSILDHPGIKVEVGKTFKAVDGDGYDHVFYSGPMDGYFDFKLGRLQYRGLRFERFDGSGDYQGNAVVNYCEEKVPYTRIAEHKHFTPWEEHDQTVCFREYSHLAGENDTPYYPLRLASDKALLKSYMGLAENTTQLTFIGRLGTYRYLDMHAVIGESLDLATKLLAEPETSRWPKFSAAPL